MDNDMFERLVNVNNVAKVTAEAGLFMLIPVSEDFNLLATGCFILRLNDQQFWKVQCKLEAPERNVWLYKSKSGITKSEGLTADEVKRIYFKAINAGSEELLNNTRLTLDGTIQLYVDNTRYYGIQGKYLSMAAAGQPPVKKLPIKDHLLIDDIHLMAPYQLSDNKCEYLKEVALC